MILQFK